jgi:hypothetical protein
MPGHFLIAKCSCGFSGHVHVGVTEPSVSSEAALLVAAFDPNVKALVTLTEGEATERRLTVYPDPYYYDPFKLFLEGDLSEIPRGSNAVFRCPSCGKIGMRFYRCGFWD